MTGDDAARDLAEGLLSAQVDYIIAEMSDERFVANVSVDTAAVLEVLESVRVVDTIDSDQVKDTIRMFFMDIVGSQFAGDMAVAVADGVYDASANEDFFLGSVIPRANVDELVKKVLSMHSLQDRLLERFTESPLLAVVASRFVGQLVADFMHNSRERAERIPGVAPVLSFGRNATSRFRGEKTLDQRIGNVAARGAQAALRRTNTAIRHLLRDPSFGDAIMQVWDLHANEPVADLRLYLTQLDLRELVEIVYRLLLSVRETPYFDLLLDDCVDVLYANYGEHSVRALLSEMGLSGEHIEQEIVKYAPGVIAAAASSGVLASLIRAHLEPFYFSPAVLAMLAR
ncbi:hypothetical protein [Smaragdicoccus niigatensis]|uniref:hypothetical protein n=1 Tax=Smaragdicoccus niigatensis TaxID=359359 RepID=UPI00036FCF00|nr:hypothetical protein [Smaragdicoccus niigatensis]